MVFYRIFIVVTFRSMYAFSLTLLLLLMLLPSLFLLLLLLLSMFTQHITIRCIYTLWATANDIYVVVWWVCAMCVRMFGCARTFFFFNTLRPKRHCCLVLVYFERSRPTPEIIAPRHCWVLECLHLAWAHRNFVNKKKWSEQKVNNINNSEQMRENCVKDEKKKKTQKIYSMKKV